MKTRHFLFLLTLVFVAPNVQGSDASDLLYLFGRQNVPGSSESESVSSILKDCYSKIASYPQLSGLLLRLGAPQSDFDYVELCDNISVFSKVGKIQTLLENIGDLYEDTQPILLEFSKILGAEDASEKDTTIFGYTKKLRQAIKGFKGVEDQAIKKAIGKTNDGSGNENLIETLNQALYTLSTRPLVEEVMQDEPGSLKKQLEQIATFLAQTSNVSDQKLTPLFGDVRDTEYFLNSSIFSCFYYVFDALKHAGPFFTISDIQSARKAIGSSDDHAEQPSLYGVIKKVMQTIQTPFVERKDLLEVLIGKPDRFWEEENSLVGSIKKIYEPVFLLLNQTLGDVRSQSCCVLMDRILPKIRDYSDSTLYEHTERLARQIRDMAVHVKDKNVFNKLGHQNLWKSVMETWSLLWKVYQVGYDLQMNKVLIGSLGTLSDGETLSSSVSEIIKGVYLADVLARIGDQADPSSGITLFSRANQVGEFMRENSIGGDVLDCFGSFEDPDFDEAGTLYRRLTFLSGAIANNRFLMTSSLYASLLQSVGYQKDGTSQTIFGCLNGLIKSLQEETQSQSVVFVQKGKDQTESLLFDLCRDAHAVSLMHVSNELMQLIKNKETSGEAAQVDLEMKFHEMNFPALIQTIYDEAYNLKKPIALNLYPVIGLLSGKSNQENLAGNIIMLRDQIKISSSRSKKQIGFPSDNRGSINNPDTNTIFGNVNWLREQLHNHYTCACLPMGYALHHFIAGVHALNDTFHCFINNVASIVLHYSSAKQIRESLIHCSLQTQKMDQTVGEIRKAIQKSQQSTIDSARRLCRMDDVFPKIKTLDALLGSLNASIQSILPEGVVVEETRLETPFSEEDSECNVVQQSLGLLENEMAGFQEEIEKSLLTFQNLPFFPFPNDGPEIMRKIQQHLTTIADDVQWIRQDGGVVCEEHIQENSNADLEGIEGAIRSLANSAEAFHRLDGLCCSSSDFFIVGITHILEGFQKILSRVFEYPDLDIFIRDQSFDDLFQITAFHFLKISEETKKIESLYDRVYSVDCMSSYSEDPFIKVTKTLNSLVEHFQKFAGTKMGIDISPFLQDEEGVLREIFRCDQIPHHLDQLHQTLETLEQAIVRDDGSSSVLSAIQKTKRLSYSPPFIESLGVCKQIFDSVALQMEFIQNQINSKKMICKKCDNLMTLPPIEKIRNDFEKLSTAFSKIMGALKQPRCCEDVCATLYHIDQLTAQITQSFCGFMDSVMEDVQKDGQQGIAFNKENFIRIGDGIKNIAVFVSGFSNQFLEIMASSDGSRCCSDRLQENLQGLFQKVLDLEQTLDSIQPTPFVLPQDSTFLNDGTPCSWPKYLKSMAEGLILWKEKLNTFSEFSSVLLRESMDVLPFAAIDSMSNPSGYLKHGIRFNKFFRVCDAISYFIPFLTQMSRSFQHLTSTLNSMDETRVSLCGSCKIQDFRNALLPWAGLLKDIASPIQGVVDMFDAAQSHNLAAYSHLMLTENSSEFGLINEENEAFYQCTKQPSIFITLVQPSRCPKVYDIKCRPFFSYKGQQVLWNEDGSITTPDLQEYKISDFSALGMMDFVSDITNMMTTIKNTFQSVDESFKHKGL